MSEHAKTHQLGRASGVVHQQRSFARREADFPRNVTMAVENQITNSSRSVQQPPSQAQLGRVGPAHFFNEPFHQGLFWQWERMVMDQRDAQVILASVLQRDAYSFANRLVNF